MALPSRILIALGLLLSLNSSAQATPVTYEFFETSFSVNCSFPILCTPPPTSFNPSVSITINGTFADLPTLSSESLFNLCTPGPPPFFFPQCPVTDFGHLIGLSVVPGTAPQFWVGFGPVGFSLSSFRVGDHNLQWTISPQGIVWLDATDDLQWSITGNWTQVNYAADSVCNGFGGAPFQSCTATGVFAPVPEPSTLALVGPVLLALFAVCRRVPAIKRVDTTFRT
jgi:hypothetical protein